MLKTTTTNDDYLKELDALFNSVLKQHNLLKIQTNSSSSSNSSISSCNNSPITASNAINKTVECLSSTSSGSSGVISLKSSSDSSIQSSLEYRYNQAVKKLNSTSTLSFDHEISDKCKIMSNSFVNRKKIDFSTPETPCYEDYSKYGPKTPKYNTLPTQLRKEKKNTTINKPLSKQNSFHLNKSSQSNRLKTINTLNAENLSNTQKCMRNHDHNVIKRAATVNNTTTITTKSSILKDKLNQLTLSSSNTKKPKSAPLGNSKIGLKKQPCLLTVDDDDTDLDVSLTSTYSKIIPNPSSCESSCSMTFTSSSSNSFSSSSNNNQLIALPRRKLMLKKSSSYPNTNYSSILHSLMRKRQQKNSVFQNRMNKNTDQNNLLVDLLLLNLLQSSSLLNTNSETSNKILSKLLNFSAKNPSSSLKIQAQNETNKIERKTSKKCSLSSSLCSSVCYLDQEHEINEDLIDIKSTSTKINEKIASTIPQNHQKTNPNQIQIPNIDDPMIFIDNLYNQIISKKKTSIERYDDENLLNLRASFQSEEGRMSNSTTRTLKSSLSESFQLNNDFSFIDLYSNKTNESNSYLSSFDSNNRTLLDWNYEDNTINNNNINNLEQSFTSSKTTLVSHGKNNNYEEDDRTECACSNCTQIIVKQESILALTNQNSMEPNWLMMKLLNSCCSSNLNESFMNKSNIDSKINFSSSPQSSSPHGSTRLRPKFRVVKNSYLFKPIGDDENDFKKTQQLHDSRAVVLKSAIKQAGNKILSESFKSLFNSVKYVCEKKQSYLFPLGLVFFNLKFNQELSISSGSMLGLSSVLQTSSVMSASQAGLSAVTTNSLESLMSFFNKS
jgi:hypothetical protein